jgi:predicted NAD/FAD-binding protein
MKIAVIGSGIAGLCAAHFLNNDHDVHVFEAESWIGGHTHTIDIENHAIDTGFIVFNDRTYPHFKKLMDTLGVKYRPTEMSFSVRNDEWKLEYNGNNLNTLFANRLNLFRPKFYRLIQDILRFNHQARLYKCDANMSLGDFLAENKFSEWFCNGYLFPMGSAIWSMGIKEMESFPLEFFVKFFSNHGLLDITNRPQWYTIEGGSRNYVPKLTNGFAHKIRLNTPVTGVRRLTNAVELTLFDNSKIEFDQLVFACHSDQALNLLLDPSKDELSILSAIKYSKNDVVVHTDSQLLPKRKLAYASWNYLITDNSSKLATLTYNMNILQGLLCDKIYCVTLNSRELIDPTKILAQYNYSHPVYSFEAVSAQQKWAEISGKKNTHYCGAYWGNGFHEDGVVSAINVCKSLGISCV